MQLRVTQQNATRFYSALQALNFVLMAMIYGYTSAYLLHKGFTNTQIGTTLGITNLLLAFLQPCIAIFIQKTGVRLSNFMAVGFSVFAILSIISLTISFSVIGVMITMVLLYLIPCALQPSLQSMYLGYLDRGVYIDYSLSRGIGSAFYALTCLLAGFIIGKFTPTALPAMYLFPTLLLIPALFLFRSPSLVTLTPNVRSNIKKSSSLPLGEHPYFYLFLVGVVFITSCSSFVGTYMLQIISRIGGTSSHLGVTMAIATIIELPAMILYSHIHWKVGNHRLLCIAVWVWALRLLLILLAPNMFCIYLAQLLHFAGFAIYIPASARYLTYAIPRNAYLKGQALLASAGTIGDLISSFGGGILIDLIGVNRALWFLQIFSAIGVVLLTISSLKGPKPDL